MSVLLEVSIHSSSCVSLIDDDIARAVFAGFYVTAGWTFVKVEPDVPINI